MKVSFYKSNYHYTLRASQFIESCFQERIVSVKDLANLLNLSPSYIYHLYRKLRNEMHFTIRAIPSYEKIKLRLLGCFLSIKSALHRNIVLKLLFQHDYVTYSAPYYGEDKGIYCIFLVPEGKEGNIVALFELLLNHGIVEDYIIRSLITIRNIVMGFEWYDFSKDLWYFRWSSLLNDVLSNTDLDSFESSDDFKTSTLNVKFDLYDLIILHHMEYDIFTNIGSLTSKTGVTRQSLSYHYTHHVRKLIKLIRPYWLPSFGEQSTFYILDLTFENDKALRSLIRSLQRKTVAFSYAPYNLSSHPSILLSGFLPYKEFFNLTNFLDHLRDYHLIKDYALYIINMESSHGKALPYHCYDGSQWCFDLEPCIKEISRLVRQAHKGMIRLAKAVDRSIESK